MKKYNLKTLFSYRNVWMALFLLLGNGLATSWTVLTYNQEELRLASPVLHPEIAEIRQHWQAGDAVGQTFQVVVTDQMAEETIAWFLEGRGLPFSHPQVAIRPDGVEGGGYVYGGFRVVATGRLRVWLDNGRLQGEVLEVKVAGITAPSFVLDLVSSAQSAYDQINPPIEITRLELREGEVLLEGFYK